MPKQPLPSQTSDKFAALPKQTRKSAPSDHPRATANTSDTPSAGEISISEEAGLQELKALHEKQPQAKEQATSVNRLELDYDLLSSRFLKDQRWAPWLRAIVRTVDRYRSGYIPMGRGANRRDTIRRAAKAAQSLETNLVQIDLRELVAALAGPAADGPRNPPTDCFDTDACIVGGNLIFPSTLPRRLDEVFLLLMLLERMSGGLRKVADTMPIRRHRPPVPDPLLFGCEMLRNRWRDIHQCLPTFSMNHGSIGDLALQLFGPKGLGFPETEVATALKKSLQMTNDDAAAGPPPTPSGPATA